jgi:MFS family permease
LESDFAMPAPKNRVHRIAVSCFFFLAGLCFSSWGSRIPDIQQKLHLNNADLGTVLLGLPTGLLISLPMAGWLVSKFGSKLVLIFSALLYAGTLPVLGLVQTKTELIAALFLFGLGGNMLNISMNTQAVGTENLYGRSIMASYHGIWSLAGFSGAAVGALMIGFGLSPLEHFVIISGAAALIILGASNNVLKNDLNNNKKEPVFAKLNRSLFHLGIIAFCSMICEGTMFDWSGVYFQKIIRPDRSLVTAGYTAFMCTMAIGRFIGDWVVTKFGKKKTLQCSGALTALGLIIAVIFPFFVTGVLGFLLVGAGVSSVVPLIYGSAGKSKTMSAGLAIAAVSTIGYLGFLVGPPFIGFIAQASSLKVSLLLIAVLGSVITVMATRTKIA